MKTKFSSKTICCVILVGLFGVSSATFAQTMPFGSPAGRVKPNWQDLSYAKLGDREKLDIYLPDEEQGPFPVIIYIHGGAWMGGSKNPGAAVAGLNRGYAVVAVGYTLSQEAIFPRQIYEIKAAIRWLRANAKEYQLNPDKFAVWGDSAGGHLAALAGTSGDVNDLEDLSMGNPKQSGRVQAVVDWYGPTDFLKMDEQFRESGVANPMQHSVEGSPESLLLGKLITQAPELVKAANPQTYISEDDPPIFIQHGKLDNLVPYQQSVEFEAKLVKVLDKDKVTLELLEGAGHGGPAFHTPENIDKVFDFLDKYLKNDGLTATITKYIIFTGRVQGVGFRNRTRMIAGRYPITGFVKNLQDGTVEMLAQGRAEDIDNFIRDIKEVFADNIKETRIEEVDFDPKYTNFQITY